MLKEIAIGEKKVNVMSNAATPVYYKRIFHQDLLVIMNKMQSKKGELPDEISELLPSLAYVMHMQAEKQTEKATEDDYITWLEGFEVFDFITAAPEIFSVYNSNRKQDSKPKN